MSQSKNNKPKVFISHAWEDKAVVRQLEERLRAAGAEVWVDHVGIRGGDSLPKRISDALEWCDTLVLVWSAASRASKWVKLEWENAISLDKLIIPCVLDETNLFPIMARTAYINFHQIDQGTTNLLHALGLNDHHIPESSLAKVKEISIPHGPLVASSDRVAQPKKPVASPTVVAPAKRPQVLPLRDRPLENYSIDDVKTMLKEKGFFDSSWNQQGKGLKHFYEKIERAGKKLVIDGVTELIWQQAGSDELLTYDAAAEYVQKLNREKFAGYPDWRLPTLEEAMSLMEPMKKNGDLYIDPTFDKNQRWIWTADKDAWGVAWPVSFSSGFCSYYVVFNTRFVRAVRCEQKDLPITKPSATPEEISVPHGQLVVSPDSAAQPKKPIASPAITTPTAKKLQVLSLRDQPLENYSVEDVKAMLKEKDFFDSSWNKQGKGLKHHYETIEQNGEKLVRDHATGLMWQQSGSKEYLAFDAAAEYVQELNRKKFAGFDDWRLPTLEEAMSLMEFTKRNGDLFIDPVFNKNQRWIRTADKEASGVAWGVLFYVGACYGYHIYGGSYYVRAVRSGQ